MMTESRRDFRSRLWLDTPRCIELYGQESVGRTDEFCVEWILPFKTHESCIKGAIRVRGGVLKSTPVVNDDRQCTMYIRTQSLSVPQS